MRHALDKTAGALEGQDPALVAMLAALDLRNNRFTGSIPDDALSSLPALRRAALGEQHPSVGDTYNNMAVVY